jgi:hypothetical protein
LVNEVILSLRRMGGAGSADADGGRGSREENTYAAVPSGFPLPLRIVKPNSSPVLSRTFNRCVFPIPEGPDSP